MTLILPENYDPVLDIRHTQEAIKYIRDTFQREFGNELHLSRVSAPLFVTKSSGLNDNLNGVESPVHFDMKAIPQLNHAVGGVEVTLKLCIHLPNGNDLHLKNTVSRCIPAFTPI